MTQKSLKHLILFQQCNQKTKYWKVEGIKCNTGNKKGPILWPLKIYGMHPSVARIKTSVKNAFSFENMDKKFIEKVTKDLDSKKSALQNDVPCKIPTFNGTYI